MNITVSGGTDTRTYTAATELQLRRLIKRLTPTIQRRGDWIAETRGGITSWRLSEEGEKGFTLMWQLQGIWDRLPLATRREIVRYARVQVRRRRRVAIRVRRGAR